VADLDGEVVGVGQFGEEAGQRAQVAGSERRRELDRQLSGPCPEGRDAVEEPASSSSAPRRRCSWVMVLGSLNTKRKSAGASSAQAATVRSVGSP